MTTAPHTPATLAAAVRAQLDAWDGRIRVDITIDGCRIQLAADGPGAVYAEYLHVPTELRRGGYGSAVVEAVTGWADQRGVTLRLGASPEYGTPVKVLRDLYGRYGFVTVGRVELGQMERRPNPAKAV